MLTSKDFVAQSARQLIKQPPALPTAHHKATTTGPSLSDSYVEIISPQFLLLCSQPHANLHPDRYRKRENGQNPPPKPLLGRPHCHSQGQERISRRCFPKWGREEEHRMSITFQPHFVASFPPPAIYLQLIPYSLATLRPYSALKET